MSKIAPCLWFDGRAEEAMSHYLSIFERSAMLSVSRYGKGMPMPEGTVLVATFEIEGQEIMALNGGADFSFTPAISLLVHCDDQVELDHLWLRLGEGGEPGQCGWLKDKFGVSWQIVPRALDRMMKNGDPKRVGRMMQALMKMTKLDIAQLEAAYDSA
jgi:predicted 3-demethylubiquinone-9 3-methyltransferase (glyoxalase superfamily)